MATDLGSVIIYGSNTYSSDGLETDVLAHSGLVTKTFAYNEHTGLYPKFELDVDNDKVASGLRKNNNEFIIGAELKLRLIKYPTTSTTLEDVLGLNSLLEKDYLYIKVDIVKQNYQYHASGYTWCCVCTGLNHQMTDNAEHEVTIEFKER